MKRLLLFLTLSSALFARAEFDTGDKQTLSMLEYNVSALSSKFIQFADVDWVNFVSDFGLLKGAVQGFDSHIKNISNIYNLLNADIKTHVTSSASSLASIKSTVSDIKTTSNDIKAWTENIYYWLANDEGSWFSSMNSELQSINSYASSIDGKLDSLLSSSDSDYSSVLSSIDGKLDGLDYSSDLTKMKSDLNLLNQIVGGNVSYPSSTIYNRLNAINQSLGTKIGSNLQDIHDAIGTVSQNREYIGLSLNLINNAVTAMKPDVYNLRYSLVNSLVPDVHSILEILQSSDDDPDEDDDGDNTGDILEKVTSLDDNIKTLFQAAFSVSDIDYADIQFSSNSVPTEETVELSINDFFSQCLNLIHAGVKVSASETRFLKHILERMPNMATKDTSEDEEELSGNLDELTSSIDSLKEAFDLELSFKEDVEDYFDYSALKDELDGSSLPSYVTISIPEFMGINEQVLTISVTPWYPFLDVSRQCFGIFYWCLIGSFVFFAFRLFLPLAMKFAGLVGKVLYW